MADRVAARGWDGCLEGWVGGGEEGEGEDEHSPERIRLGKLSIADAQPPRARDDPWTKFEAGDDAPASTARNEPPFLPRFNPLEPTARSSPCARRRRSP